MILSETSQKHRILNKLKEYNIIFYFNTQDLPAVLNESLLISNLSIKDKVYLSSIINRYARIRSLIGRLMLWHIAVELDLRNLAEIEISPTGKPYFSIYPDIHFNISHSKQMVVCAISLDRAIGIDIEFNKALELENYESYFHKAEWNSIKNSTDPLKMFYTLWTRKEALIKADGRGMQINLKSINSLSKKVDIEGNSYEVQNINLGKNYSTAIASPFIKPFQLINFEISSNIISDSRAINTSRKWN